jgi:uncharacterized protein
VGYAARAGAAKLQRVESDARILVNLTRGNIVCEHVEIADRPRLRMRGLLGRESLETGEGMLLQPAPSIHTWFMRFAIDAVFMDGTLRVKKIVEGLRPWRIASARRAWGVLELAAGEVEQRGIAIGDQLGVVEVTDRLGAFVASEHWDDGGPVPSRVAALANGDANGSVEFNGKLTLPGNEPTRVLLVGSDRRFRSVAAALLTRRGCAVTLGDRATNIADLAKREAADVVVLDAGVSLTDAAHGAAQIETLDPPVGIVVVGEEAEQALSAMPVLSKWGSFDGLYGAIEHARPVRDRGSSNGSS